MTQEEKTLLLKDLCVRLPYKVKLKIGEYSDYTLHGIVPNRKQPIVVSLIENEIEYKIEVSVEIVKPYLRPMSSMTEEERNELFLLSLSGNYIQIVEFYISHHLDYKCLIGKGLALEAPEGMYNNEDTLSNGKTELSGIVFNTYLKREEDDIELFT